ncbi:hypothetical protein [Pedobacter ginsengisoli]|uniref:hypothetical protein n=1 Tax=Pedobacter ginsengisoli TaxID=363852 RepID=UPI00254FB9FB|nr:hypothetical protein [Pedobacter ginsengisoli]
MKSLNMGLGIPGRMRRVRAGVKKEHTLLGGLLLLWGVSPELMRLLDETSGFIDQSIWLLVLLALISFLLAVGLCWWLLGRFWVSMGLPAFGDMVLHFNRLVLWQKLGFYFASFALLLLSAVGCLAAVL